MTGRAVAVVLLGGFVGLLVLLVPSGPAGACSCAAVGSAEERVAELGSDGAVFTGEVTGSDVDGGFLDGLFGMGAQSRHLEVEVDQVYRGEVGRSVVLVTAAQSTACGADPDVGTEALVVASRVTGDHGSFEAEPGDLTVSSCGSLWDVEEAAGLGPGSPPVGPGETLGADTRLLLLVGLAGVLTPFVVVGGTLLVRRRRRRAAGA